MDTKKRINKILSVYLESEGSIRPHFFLTGATGSGKSFTVTTLAEAHNLPVVNVNTAQLTNEGIAGNSLSKTLAALQNHQGNPVIVFFDEFDKAISKEAEVTSGSIQQEILKIIEDNTTEVFGEYGRYNRVQTNNVLFVFAGSFNGADIKSLSDLLEHNVKPELLGRVGLHFEVKRTPLEELLKLVENSKLLQDYAKIIKGASKEIAIEAISREIIAQYDNNIIGVRIINSLIHQYFINGGFTEVTGRMKITHTNKADRDLSFN